MKLELTHNVAGRMKRHAEEIYPDECCGFFFGNDGEIRMIHQTKEVRNIRTGNRRRRFKIDPKDYQQAETYAFENNLDLLGVYHSHPDHPAVPSEHDRKVALPWFSYIILSVEDGKTGDIRSWRLNDSRQFEEEAVKIFKDNNKN